MIKKLYYLILFLLSIISIYLGFNSTIIPNKILYIIIAVYIIFLLLILLLITRKKKFIIFLGILLSIPLLIGNAALSYVYIRTNTFFNKITNVEYETSNYSIIILKDSTFTKLEDLKEIGLYKQDIDSNYNDALEELNSKVKIDNKNYDNILNIVNDLYTKKLESILINENYIDIINETDNKFKENTKVLDTLSIKKIKEKKEIEQEISKLGNFNIYISGIDTYGEISTVSRSDVNILATVDMKNNKILLTNTPRDYYVQLHGTTGTKDKLTHAGVYGIDMSMQTLEDLYETKINHYIRVNFNTLIKLVDLIGGVDIYSDQNLYLGKIYIKYGWNHLNGTEALAFSRERHSYIDGDRHRGRNQQQVIEAIIKKVTQSRDINTYLNLLSTMENSVQTNIDKKLINGFINKQVSENLEWKTESISVTGYDSGNYTYSYPGQLLYVMEPDYNSLNTAKAKIKEIIDNN